MLRESLVGLLALVWAGFVPKATLRGTLHYAGAPSAQSLPHLSYGKVRLQAHGAPPVWADIATATSSWTVTHLPPGHYRVEVELSETPIQLPQRRAGSAWALLPYVTVAAGETTSLRIELLYCVHVLQPFDNAKAWPGKLFLCPYGSEVANHFTLAWAQVPLAAWYEVRLRRWSCRGWLADTRLTTSQTFIPAHHPAVPGEEFLLVEIQAFDDHGRQLAAMPPVCYEDGKSDAYYLHAAVEPGTH